MFDTFLRFLDYFNSSHYTTNERRVRDRMFTTLLLSSMFMLIAAVVSFYFSGLINSTMMQRLAYLFMGQAACLVSLRFFKDTEWPSLFYLMFYQIFQLLDVLQNAPVILNPFILAMPVSLVYGFFCIVDPFKRIALMSCTLFSSVLAVVLLPDTKNPSYMNYSPDDFASIVCLSAFFVNASAMACLYFYDYVKKASEREMLRDLSLRIQTIRLGEISSSLKSLIPEFRIALDALERQAESFETPLHETKEQLLQDMEVEIARMSRVSQSISWVYRAYRKEDIAGIFSEQFLDQLDVLMKGKFYYSAWKISFNNQIKATRMAGPIPTIILLILTLTDQLVHIAQMESHKKREMKTLDVNLLTHGNEVEIQLSWSNFGDEFYFDRFERTLLPTWGFDSDFRLELIAELASSARSKLEFVKGKEKSSIVLRGAWLEAVKA